MSLIHGTLFDIVDLGKSIGPGIRAATFLVTEGHLFYAIILFSLLLRKIRKLIAYSAVLKLK